MIADSHVHVSDFWYEPVETLLYQMERNGVEHAALVQMSGQTDNRYLMECARRFPGRFAPIVAVDTESPSACDDLRRLADEGASGVRLRAFNRSPGDDPLAIWHTAEELGLAVSCAGFAAHFADRDFADVVAAVPSLTIVIEHIGSGKGPDANQEESAQRIRALGLSRFSNVYVKIPGLGEFCRRARPPKSPFPFEEPIPPYLEMAYEKFGPARMMWGSDFSLVGEREGYRNALQFVMQRFASKSREERDFIFGRTAVTVFPVRA